jgi:hypothetical protein
MSGKNRPPANLEEANKAAREETYRRFQEQAVRAAEIPQKPAAPKSESNNSGWSVRYDDIKAAFKSAYNVAAEGASIVKDAALSPVQTYNKVTEAASKAIDDAAIKPGGGATSVERYHMQHGTKDGGPGF